MTFFLVSHQPHYEPTAATSTSNIWFNIASRIMSIWVKLLQKHWYSLMPSKINQAGSRLLIRLFAILMDMWTRLTDSWQWYEDIWTLCSLSKCQIQLSCSWQLTGLPTRTFPNITTNNTTNRTKNSSNDSTTNSINNNNIFLIEIKSISFFRKDIYGMAFLRMSLISKLIQKWKSYKMRCLTSVTRWLGFNFLMGLALLVEMYSINASLL